jgi:Caspase domain
MAAQLGTEDLLMRASWKSSLPLPALIIAGLLQLPGSTIARAQLASPGQGEIRALIIGVDHYATRRNLRGAVADARDLEQSVKKGGVRDLTVLIDQDASRRQVETAMERLVADSRSGDLIIVSFAGHGAQSPERIKDSDPDHVDEVFVLPAFDDHGPATAERILDKEINVWLKRIEQKGAHTLFLADTCHGGGLTREVDLRAGEMSYRQTSISIASLDDALTPISTDADRLRQPEEFDRVTFLAAADKWTKAPEVRIEGQPTLRGALSYAVARAFEGGADRNGDGKTTRRELFEYARQVVQQYSQSRQVIYTEPNRRTDLMESVVFKRAGAPEQPAAFDDRAGSTVRIAILNGSTADLAGVEPYSAKIEVVGKDQQPDLVWDAAGGDVVSGLGDIVARGIARRDIADVLDRTAAVAAIAKLSESRPQRILLAPNDKHHREGETVTFRAEDVKGKSIILFNIAGNGTVQFEYPKTWDRNLQSQSEVFQLSDIKVTPPFGADYVVAIVSDRRLPELEGTIRAFDNIRAAARIPAILRKHLPNDPSARIGFAGLFTTP